MAIDARVRYTKMVIKGAFIKLLSEKSFKDITLKEVCQLAGINRSTFYKYYRDIYDWREQMAQDCVNGAQAVIDEIDSTDIETILTQMLLTIQNNIALFHVLFSENIGNGNHALEQIFALSLKKGETKFKNEALSNPTGQAKWKYHFLAYGCIGVIQSWIKDGMVEPAAEVSAYIAAILKTV